jgi:pyruvate kinase
MDVVRLNFSHGTLEGQKQTLANVHEAMRRTGRTVGILQDLQGPKIRIGTLREPFVELVAGREVVITTEETPGTAERISTSFANLVQDVTPGETILLDDGKLRLTVLEVRGHDVRCRI